MKPKDIENTTDGNLCLAVMDWHGGQSSAIYALCSNWLGHLKRDDIHSDEEGERFTLDQPRHTVTRATVESAIAELSPDNVPGLMGMDYGRNERRTLAAALRARFGLDGGDDATRDRPDIGPLYSDEDALREAIAQQRYREHIESGSTTGPDGNPYADIEAERAVAARERLAHVSADHLRNLYGIDPPAHVFAIRYAERFGHVWITG